MCPSGKTGFKLDRPVLSGNDHHGVLDHFLSVHFVSYLKLRKKAEPFSQMTEKFTLGALVVAVEILKEKIDIHAYILPAEI
jgi:hypothetical protein